MVMDSFSKAKKIFAATTLILTLIFMSLVSAYLYENGARKNNADHLEVDDVTLNGNKKLHMIFLKKPEKGLLIYIANQPHSKEIIESAEQFARQSYYVAIIDNQELLTSPINTHEQCLNIATELSEINSKLSTRYKIDSNQLPILVASENSSATLYAALAQAEEHKFHAAISINFNPALSIHTALCKQLLFSKIENQQLTLIGVNRLPTSLYVFQDKNIALENIKFAEKVGNVKLTISNDATQTAQTEAIQILQWLDPRLSDQSSSDTSNTDLPLIEVPVDGQQIPTDSIALILTGDGGWAEIDKRIAKKLAEKGIATVALDSLSYFWKPRTPEETAKDIETTIVRYLENWNKKNVILIGYSFGADVLPFIANNLSANTQQKVSLIALLGMGKTAAFEFRLASWMNADKNPNRLPILPEIAKMKWAHSICIYGVDDSAANCLPTAELGVKTISMSGDHHFDEKYDELVQHIIENEKLRPHQQ